MADNKSYYRYFDITIAAGEIYQLNVFGRFMSILYNSSTTDPLVAINGQPEEKIPAGLSIKLSDEEYSFKKIEIRNSSGSSMSLKLAFSSGEVYDNRFAVTSTLDVNTATDTISTPAALTIPTTAPGAASIAASTSRREVVIQNNGANPLWIGDANVDGANNRGIKVAAGDSIVLNTSAAIYMRATGASTTVSYMTLSK